MRIADAQHQIRAEHPHVEPALQGPARAHRRHSPGRQSQSQFAHRRAARGEVGHDVPGTLQIDWSVNRSGRSDAGGRRPAAGHDRYGAEPRLGRAADARRRGRRRRAGGAPGAARHARRLRRLPLPRRAARRSPGHLGARAGARARHRPGRGLRGRAPRGARARLEHVRPRRAGWRDPCDLPQDPHVRRGGGRRRVPRVSELRAGERDRAVRDGEWSPARSDHLLRPPLPRAVPDPRAARRARDHGARELHAGDRRGALGGPAARPRDREPGVRHRARPGTPRRARWRQLRQLDDRRSLGRGARPRARGRRAPHRRRPRPGPPGPDPREAAEPGEPGRVGLQLARGSDRLVATAPKSAPDKRRMILDAAVRVFARQGFHHCRVSDVADEAGVAYGLVYHYFDSKEEILNTLCLERWQIMLDAIGEIDARELPSRDKLRSVAGFIIDSYRHDPHLMKVIIVEVTRAANSFGAVHLEEIRKAYEGIAAIVEAAREEGSFKSGIPSEFAAMCFYGAIEQLLTGWIFEVLPRTEEEFEGAKDLIVEAICGGLENGAADRPPVSG